MDPLYLFITLSLIGWLMSIVGWIMFHVTNARLKDVIQERQEIDKAYWMMKQERDYLSSELGKHEQEK